MEGPKKAPMSSTERSRKSREEQDTSSAKVIPISSSDKTPKDNITPVTESNDAVSSANEILRQLRAIND